MAQNAEDVAKQLGALFEFMWLCTPLGFAHQCALWYLEVATDRKVPSA